MKGNDLVVYIGLEWMEARSELVSVSEGWRKKLKASKSGVATKGFILV